MAGREPELDSFYIDRSTSTPIRSNSGISRTGSHIGPGERATNVQLCKPDRSHGAQAASNETTSNDADPSWTRLVWHAAALQVLQPVEVPTGSSRIV